MSTKLHIVDPPPEEDFNYYSYIDDPGAMFRWPDFDTEDREGWCISLPNRAGLWWTTYKASGTNEMWDVIGVPPNITVKPSINAGDDPGPGNWHGFITNGVMEP